MESTPRLYETRVAVVRQQQNGLDRRHLQTLAWMMVGLIQAGTINLTAWAPYVHSRAVYAQSRVRRFARWLEKTRIDVHALQGPRVQHALAEWEHHVWSVALDTSLWWNTDGLVRLSLVYRGRAVPSVWTVREHPSSRVAYDVQKAVLDQVAQLRPFRCTVVLTAARGCADTPLRAHLTELGWHWRMRITGSFGIDREGKRQGKVKRLPVSPGKARFWHPVDMTKPAYGPVHLALGRPIGRQEYWFVGSDEPTESKTCAEQGRRFDIEEHCLDDTSHGFQLESSLIRSANALERLCGVLAITTLALVAQGTAVVTQGQRRGVDSHGFRGQRSLKIGWNGVKLALSKGYELITCLHISPEADPVPAMASKLQHQKPSQLFFALEVQDAVA